MNLYLHIGTRKAGSSYIQNFCNLNKDKLFKAGYFYPENNNFNERKGKSAGHWRLHKIFEKRENYNLNDYLPANCPSENVILSNEALTSEHCDIFNMAEKARALLSDKFQVKIIIYVRRQDLYVGSLYNESIISGNHKKYWSFDEFLATNKLPELDYYFLIKSWIKEFGKENVMVRPFEKGQLYHNEILKDFLYCIGLGWHDDFFIPDESSRNSSPDAVLVEAIRILNRIPLPLRPMYKDFLDNVFDELAFEGKYGSTLKKSIISPGRGLEILETYASSNARTAREFLGREDGILFYEPEPPKNDIWEPVKINDPDLVLRLFSLFLEQKSIELQELYSSQRKDSSLYDKKLNSFEKQMSDVKNHVDMCGKRLSIMQCQFDSGCKTQEIYKNQIDLLNRDVKVQGGQLSKRSNEVQQLKNLLYGNALATYRHARQKKWKRFCRLLRSPWLNEEKLLQNSGLVDPYYYFENYPQAITAGITAVEHYVRFGAQQGINPSAKFNTRQYLADNPEVALNGINPLVHFLLYRSMPGVSQN